MLRKTEPAGRLEPWANSAGRWNARAKNSVGLGPARRSKSCACPRICRRRALSRRRKLPTSPPPGLIALFVAFAKMSLAGFGGVLVFARRGIVDQHRWMTAEEFNETFALCHFLPGPNIVNLSWCSDRAFAGIAGGIAAFAGLVGPPVVIVTILAALYARFGEIDALRRILAGVSCAAVGLLISVVFRMMMPLIKKRDAGRPWSLMAAVFVAIGLLRLPLPAVLLVAIPLSIAITIRHAPAGRGMNESGNPILTLALTFGVMSLFAVGGANSAIPEMHRVAVDVQHWLTDRAVRRRVRDLAIVAGAERADRHPDRLCGRGHQLAHWSRHLRCACPTAVLAYLCQPVSAAVAAIRAGRRSSRQPWSRFRSA